MRNSLIVFLVANANKGILVQKCKATFTGCTSAGNSVGVCVENSDLTALFENCVIAANEGDGVLMNGVTKATLT